MLSEQEIKKIDCYKDIKWGINDGSAEDLRVTIEKNKQFAHDLIAQNPSLRDQFFANLEAFNGLSAKFPDLYIDEKGLKFLMHTDSKRFKGIIEAVLKCKNGEFFCGLSRDTLYEMLKKTMDGEQSEQTIEDFEKKIEEYEEANINNMRKASCLSSNSTAASTSDDKKERLTQEEIVKSITPKVLAQISRNKSGDLNGGTFASQRTNASSSSVQPVHTSQMTETIRVEERSIQRDGAQSHEPKLGVEEGARGMLTSIQRRPTNASTSSALLLGNSVETQSRTTRLAVEEETGGVLTSIQRRPTNASTSSSAALPMLSEQEIQKIKDKIDSYQLIRWGLKKKSNEVQFSTVTFVRSEKTLKEENDEMVKSNKKAALNLCLQKPNNRDQFFENLEVFNSLSDLFGDLYIDEMKLKLKFLMNIDTQTFKNIANKLLYCGNNASDDDFKSLYEQLEVVMKNDVDQAKLQEFLSEIDNIIKKYSGKKFTLPKRDQALSEIDSNASKQSADGQKKSRSGTPESAVTLDSDY